MKINFLELTNNLWHPPPPPLFDSLSRVMKFSLVHAGFTHFLAKLVSLLPSTLTDL